MAGGIRKNRGEKSLSCIFFKDMIDYRQDLRSHLRKRVFGCERGFACLWEALNQAKGILTKEQGRKEVCTNGNQRRAGDPDPAL